MHCDQISKLIYIITKYMKNMGGLRIICTWKSHTHKKDLYERHTIWHKINLNIVSQFQSITSNNEVR